MFFPSFRSRSMPLLADDLFPMSSSDESVAEPQQKKVHVSNPNSAEQTEPSTSTTKRRHADLRQEKKDKRYLLNIFTYSIRRSVTRRY